MKFKTFLIVALMATLWLNESCSSHDSSSKGCKPVTFDGYTYDVVQIGDQCWFAENLRTRHYANGDEIPGDLSYDEWQFTDEGAMAVYDSEEFIRALEDIGESIPQEWRGAGMVETLKTYGRLYNYFAVDDERGLCPSGWHVPNYHDWTIMIDFLGGDEVAGNQMKSTSGWEYEGNGTNSSGFSGFPGGMRSPGGNFSNGGYEGYWWSYESRNLSYFYPWCRVLNSEFSDVYRNWQDGRFGYSVRCIKEPS